MPTTGLELSRIFDLNVGQSYTGYLDPPKKNRLLQQALFTAIQLRYKGLIPQWAYDDIAGVIKTRAPYVPVNNQIFLNTVGVPNIPDYEDLLAVKAEYAETFYNITVVDATNTTPVVIELQNRNNIRSTEKVELTGIIGNPAANGTFFVKKISDFKFEIYTDEFFQVPVAGTGAYISGGQLSRIYFEWCRMYRSDQKIDTFATPSVRFPKFEVAETQLKFYPDNITCRRIELDYITKAVVLPDVNNNVIDLELTYRYNFLLYIIYAACANFAEEVKDKDLYAVNSAKLANG